MKTTRTVWIIIAVCLIIMGVIIGTWSLSKIDFNFENLATKKTTSNEHGVTQDFSNIKIDVDTSDIEFVYAQTQECKIVSVDTDKIKHNISVKNDTLYISAEDTSKWYDHIGIYFGETSLTIHLPKECYDSLDIDADTSDITVPNDFMFNTASIETDTGDIGFSANMSNTLEISTDTGHISFGNIEAQDIKLESDTGDITFNSAKCKNVSVETDTGDVRFNNTIKEKILVKTSTGDVIFDNSDANEISITTNTGDVRGRLLSPKAFICKSDTGDVNVPNSVVGGKCKITTNTGDIEIYILAK